MDDIFKCLPPKDLTAIYFSNMLKCNPKSYSFKDKLIAIHLNEDFVNIADVSYRAEVILENLISHKGRVFEALGWDIMKSYSTAYDYDSNIVYPRVITGTPCFIKRDNMYVKPEAFLRYDTLKFNAYNKFNVNVLNENNLLVMKHSAIFNAMLQLHILLCSEGSVAKHLIWQLSNWKALSLSDTVNMAPVLDSLNSDDAPIPCVRYSESDVKTFAPVNTGVINIADDWNDIDNPKKTDIIDSNLHATYFKCVAYGLEILYQLYKIPNPKYRAVIEEKLLRNTSPVSDLLYTVEGSKIVFANNDIDEIVHTNDSKQRFDLICKYLNTYNVYTAVKPFVSAKVHVPEWLLELVGFCTDYAHWSARVKYISILYKYCLDNKLIDTLKKTSESDYSELIEYISSVADKDTVAETSLLDLDLGEPYSHNCENDALPKATSPTVEALDKISAAYEENRYTFEVDDVVDTNPNPKYINIASKSEILNKTLIKRIKDIKVYNSGGKSPGKSKGKLDRKALYRYKTSKDIFYDNTYKVKESDLAFGIVLDVSGSMHGKGIENGVATMIILHETLKALGINHSIITHTSDGKYHTRIRRYQSFREDKTYTTLKNYALGSIKSYYGNCDSGALFYMEKALLRTKNKDKICLIFSDGEPTECSGTELKEQVKSMERKGIKVIGIGVDFESIREYYTEYANGRNLTEMFNIVSEILRQYVLEKEN